MEKRKRYKKWCKANKSGCGYWGKKSYVIRMGLLVAQKSLYS